MPMVAAVAVMAAGTAYTAYNQKQQANTAAAVGQYNSKITGITSEYNAKMIEQEAAYNATQAEQTANYNAQTTEAAADYNSILSENDAQLADMTGRENIRRMRVEGQKTMSTQQARYTKAGVVADTGTPLEVMAETAGLNELNVLDQKRAADAEASRTRTQAAMSRYLAYKDAENTRYFGAQKAWATRYFGAQQAYATRYFGGQQAQGQALYGDVAAQGYNAASTGTILSGAGQIAGAYASSKKAA